MKGSFEINLGGGVALDASVLLDTRLLVTANSGAGKSYLLRLIAEQTANRLQTIIIDPEGEYTSLRAEVDMLLVGEEGEVACEVATAEELARSLCEFEVSAIVDLSELGKPDRRKYVRVFLESLMSVPKSMYHPMLIIIDEAHMFCPQQGIGENESGPAVMDLACRGRKRGFAALLATQRISKLHKDVAAEMLNVLTGRTTLDTDQARSGDALGFDKATRLTLRELKPGEFWVHGPAFGDTINGVSRLKARHCKTKHPEAGHRHELKPPAASKAIQKLLPQFEAIRAKAVAEIADFEAAKKRIAVLEKDLRASERARTTGGGMTEQDLIAKGKYVPRAELARVEKESERYLANVRKSAQREVKRLRKEVVDRLVNFDRQFRGMKADALRDQAYAFIGQLENIIEHSKELRKGLSETDFAMLTVDLDLPPLPAPSTTIDRSSGSEPSLKTAVFKNTGDGRLNKCERALLNVLGQFPDGRTRRQLAILAGYSVSKSTTRNALSKLRGASLILEECGLVHITGHAIEAFGPFDPIPSGEERIEHWRSKLNKCEDAIFVYLVSVFPGWASRDRVADETGYDPAKSTIRNALSKLRNLDLIEENGRELRAAEALFNE